MKLLKLICFFSILAILGACKDGDEDYKNCKSSDWIGTYSGTIKYVTSQDSTVDVNLTVSLSGDDDLIFVYETAGSSVEFNPLKQHECSIFWSENLDPPNSEITRIGSTLFEKIRIIFDYTVISGGENQLS